MGGEMVNRTRYLAFAVTLMLLLGIVSACSGGDSSGTLPPGEAPDLASIRLEDCLANGKPTLAEFGWRECIPCKKMKPVLEELAVEYGDRLNVVIVEVYEHTDLTRQHEILTIPTQIIFDRNGAEATRHIGYWDKERIVDQMVKMGIL
jgi:thioredoxin 1